MDEISFIDFEQACDRRYEGKRTENKKQLFIKIRKICGLKKENLDKFLNDARYLAQKSACESKEAFDWKDNDENRMSELEVGSGKAQKAAAFHYLLLSRKIYHAHAVEMNFQLFGNKRINYLFETPLFDSENKDEGTEILKPTAPFEWPLYILKKDIDPEDTESAVWLNPHNHHSIPLSGRGDEKLLLKEFIEDDRTFVICPIIASSGAGKTRLISEWMKPFVPNVSDTPWDAGFVKSHNADNWNEENWHITRNTLIIIDYTYFYEDVVKQIVKRATEQTKFLIRLIVIDHVFPKVLNDTIFWKAVFEDEGKIEANKKKLLFRDKLIELHGEKSNSELLRDIIAVTADPTGKILNKDSKIVVKAAKALYQMGEDTKSNAVRHPLFAALMGRTIRENESDEIDFFKWTRRDLIKHYFNKSRRLPWIKSDDNPHSKTVGQYIGCHVCVATLFRKADIKFLRKALIRDGEIVNLESHELKDIADTSINITSSQTREILKPFEPDILGENFFLFFLKELEASPITLEKKFISMLCSYESKEDEEANVKNLIATMQRLIRNLANDDQELEEVQESWQSLVEFFQPIKFPTNLLIRQAISIILVEISKHILIQKDSRIYSYVIKLVSEDDLINASSSPIWEEACKSFISFIVQLNINKKNKTKILSIIKNYELKSNFLQTGLMLIFSEGNLELAKYLYEMKPVNIDASDEEGVTVFSRAVFEENYDFLYWLISIGANIDQQLPFNNGTALIRAVSIGEVESATKLIEMGANVNETNTFSGETALLEASFKNRISCIKLLIDNGADVNFRSKNWFTPLIYSVLENNLPIVKILLENGANINHCSRPQIGQPPLAFSVVYNHIEITKFLIQENADINLCSPLLSAFIGGPTPFEDLIPTIELLIESGAKLNISSNQCDTTPLIGACRMDNFYLVKLLLLRNANPNFVSLNGSSPLLENCAFGKLKITKLLIENGANIDYSNVTEGTTALMKASEAGDMCNVELLLELGAKTNQKDVKNHTALWYATNKNYNIVVELLKKYGATLDDAEI